MNIAHAQALLGRHAAAKESIARAIDDAQRIGYDVALPSLYQVQIEVGKAAGDNELVQQAAANAVATVTRLAATERAKALSDAEARYRTTAAEARGGPARRVGLEAALPPAPRRRSPAPASRSSAVLLLLLLRAGRRRERELAVLSSTDSLTGAATRRAFVAALEAALAARAAEPAAALLVLDADHFKRLNDEHVLPPGGRRGAAPARGARALRDPARRTCSAASAARSSASCCAAPAATRRHGAPRRSVPRSPRARSTSARRLVPLTVSIGVAVLDRSRIPSVERWLGGGRRGALRGQAHGRAAFLWRRHRVLSCSALTAATGARRAARCRAGGLSPSSGSP